MINRYLDWAAKQIMGERIQAASTSLSKVETLSGYATPQQKSRLSTLRGELNILVRKRAARSAALDSHASVQHNPSPEKEEVEVNEQAADSGIPDATTDSAIPVQQSNDDNSQIQGEAASGEHGKTQVTNNPIKAIGNLFKRVFKNETASDY